MVYVGSEAARISVQSVKSLIVLCNATKIPNIRLAQKNFTVNALKQNSPIRIIKAVLEGKVLKKLCKKRKVTINCIRL